MASYDDLAREGARMMTAAWHRRDTGWFGQVLNSRRARIHVPGLEADVVVQEAGKRDAVLRADVDAAYRTE